jgi:hypothetical protein
LNIEKIDNGYEVKYQEDVKGTAENDFNSYVYHTFAFQNWTDVIDFISKNEALCD